MNYVAENLNTPPLTRKIDSLIGENFNIQFTAFLGHIEWPNSSFQASADGLYLICKKGIFRADNPSVVYFNTTSLAVIDKFVDVNIYIKQG